ncbi:MAG: ATP synthase subunit beta [Alphaproteobacteria bacterium]|nr:MAG: ATP synthase subunit beta [Alphaproteobacteria bacterium]
MTPLANRIAALIEATGPISLAQYMAICLADPRHGYYATRPAIGANGDFVTAPQVSQMFGEIIAVWCVAAWRTLASPSRLVLAEAGPGTGALMADLARAARSFPDFAAALELVLIESSAAMAAHQRAALAGSGLPVSWVAALDDLPGGPLVLIANEFLDALPVRQFVKAGAAWRERSIGLDDKSRLAWRLGAALIDPALLPAGAAAEPDGAVFEAAPARAAWVQALAERLKAEGGAALLIDYGHAASGFGDTFQAVRDHRPADPLAEPGLADLTAHVDFEPLRAVAAAAGVQASPVATQGEFLAAMGLAERARRLAASADEAVGQRMLGEARRLLHPDEMGSLFKVLALYQGGAGLSAPDLPPFLAAPPRR